MLLSLFFPTFWTIVHNGSYIEHTFYWMFGLFIDIDAGTITISWLFNFTFNMYQLWYFIAIYSTLVVLIFSIALIRFGVKLKKEGKVKKKILLSMNQSIIFALFLNLILINYLFIPIYGFHLLLAGVILSSIGYKKSKKTKEIKYSPFYPMGH
ncbi:MAG: hypothetical protein WBH31_01635 [Promethearchaeia archaeon]